jgi:hypothetical protein
MGRPIRACPFVFCTFLLRLDDELPIPLSTLLRHSGQGASTKPLAYEIRTAASKQGTTGVSLPNDKQDRRKTKTGERQCL